MVALWQVSVEGSDSHANYLLDQRFNVNLGVTQLKIIEIYLNFLHMRKL